MHILYVEQFQPHQAHTQKAKYSMQIQSHTLCPLAAVFHTNTMHKPKMVYSLIKLSKT